MKHYKNSLAEKDKYQMVSLTCTIKKKRGAQTNLLTKQKWTQRQRKQTYGYQKGKGREG